MSNRAHARFPLRARKAAPVGGAASASFNRYAASRMSSPVAASAFGCNPLR